jgi:hypothetical protein
MPNNITQKKNQDNPVEKWGKNSKKIQVIQ